MTSRLQHPTPEQQRVVGYWWSVELFSPQQVEPVHYDRERPVIDWRPGGRLRLPWDSLPTPAPTKRGEPRVWQHTLYVGLHRLDDVYEHLHRAFPRDVDAYDERPPGQSACASLVVDHHGRYVPGSAVLSSAAWGVGFVAGAGPEALRGDWRRGFAGVQEAFELELERLLVGNADAAGEVLDPERPRLDAELVCAAVAAAHSAAMVTGLEGMDDVVVRIASRIVVDRGDAQASEQRADFLNSFLLDDLLTVSEAPWGPALRQYLTPEEQIDTGARVDVAHDVRSVLGATRIERLPAGRWPSNSAHHLATSQQFAVNALFDDDDSGVAVHGVNGPPGTGKTTLLRDVLAANVVRRAAALAALPTPGVAFSGTVHTWKAGQYTRTLHSPLPELTGYEMVLSSTNNGAVQNVSDELPQRRTLHSSLGTPDYFADLAGAVARRQNAGGAAATTSAEGERWGLVAARLGRSRNRKEFFSALWFGERADPTDPSRPEVTGLLDLLKGWEADPSAAPSWQQAVDDFTAAQRRVDTLVARAAAAQQRLDDLHAARERERTASDDEAALAAERGRDIARRPDLEAALADAEVVRAGAASRYQRHRDLKPGWLERLLRGSEAARWRAELGERATALDAAEEAARAAGRDLATLDGRVSLPDAALRAARDERAAAVVVVQHLDPAVTADVQRWGAAHPSGAWLRDEQVRQLHAPWLDEELDAARSALFLRAMDLHRALWASTSGARRQLQAALDVVSGAAPPDLAEADRVAAWRTFFLLVPLVSTTFASVGRMFSGVGAEAFGWLLVDEAGQATPQAVVGAAWRCRRLLSVGDPMQLTPVLAMPRKMQQDLAEAQSVADEWVPSTGSVQHLVDRTARYGTFLPYGAEPLWVSAPLRVHRRCDEPMFGISNDIAYSGLMINGASCQHEVPSLCDSHWLDVPAQGSGSHLQQRELHRFLGWLRYLRERGVPMSSVIAVSPFRDVAAALAACARAHPGLVAGTVHTSQGKEADVVFVVLGGDVAKPGAKVWASSTPNLLNVAVSRARHRLYVIGDWEVWSRHPSFDVLAQRLPRFR